MHIRQSITRIPPAQFAHKPRPPDVTANIIWQLHDFWPPDFIDLLRSGAFQVLVSPPAVDNAITDTQAHFPIQPDSNF